MNTALQIVGYELRNVLRGRWLVVYFVLLAGLTEALLRGGAGSGGALAALVSLVLLVVPLVSIVFGLMYLYASREFNELLLSQPVSRRQLFTGLYAGVAVPLAVVLAAGIALPFTWHGVADPSHWGLLALLLTIGVALTGTFTAVAFLLGVLIEDRARGLGAGILVWFALAVVYDGVVIAVVSALAHWPVERAALVLMLLNPVDLARTVLIMELDLGAMMGYTGAVFRRAFGGTTGTVLSAGALTAWVVAPLAAAGWAFGRKDF